MLLINDFRTGLAVREFGMPDSNGTRSLCIRSQSIFY